MNSLSLLFVCGSLALLFSAQYAEGLECYTCSGETTACSADNVNIGKKTTCPSPADKSCVKIVVTTSTTSAASRGCSADTGTTCKKPASTTGTTQETCHCEDDLCNGSSSVHVSFTFIAVAMVVVAIFNRL